MYLHRIRKTIVCIIAGVIILGLFICVIALLARVFFGGYDYQFSIPYDNLEIRTICSRKAKKTVVIFYPMSEEHNPTDYIVYDCISPYLEILFDSNSPSALMFRERDTSITGTSHFCYYTPIYFDDSNPVMEEPYISKVFLRYEFTLHCYESHFVGDSVVVSSIRRRRIENRQEMDSLSTEQERKIRRGWWEAPILPNLSKEYYILRDKKLKEMLPLEIQRYFGL